MEPLWGIPYNLIAPFATLYMYTLGITDVQIGLILSVAMVVQFFFSFFGGILTDKLGRKATTMLGDFFGWCVACLVWAISDNFWLFLIAVIFNSFEQINQTAWYCLLIEDAEPKDLVGIYTWGEHRRTGCDLFCSDFRIVHQFLYGRSGHPCSLSGLCRQHADQGLSSPIGTVRGNAAGEASNGRDKRHPLR